jgi:hypothetical protein
MKFANINWCIFWKKMGYLILSARNNLYVDNLSEHSGYIQNKLIKYYENIFDKEDINNDLNNIKLIHDEIQIMIEFLIESLKDILKHKDYYQRELSKIFYTEKFKDNDWIMYTIAEMCINQNIIQNYRYKNKKYFRLKNDFSYNKLAYLEKNNNLSRPVRLIQECCKTFNIENEIEYKFKDLKHKKPLRFDFCLYGKNFINNSIILIEYDGKQHSKKIKFFHKTHNSFQEQLYRDQLKNNYVEKNGIKLIRINYNENPIKKLMEEINPLLKISIKNEEFLKFISMYKI